VRTEFGSPEWYDERWEAVPPVVRKIAADTLARVISERDKELIRRKHAEHGPHVWVHHLIDMSDEEQRVYSGVGMATADQTTLSGHHGWGTAIRNVLRDEELGAGIRDEDLPDAPYASGLTHRNWDDYYVQAVEAALGLR
jgi:hypothetical protein